MITNPTNPILDKAIAAAVQGDDDLTQRARTLADYALERAEYWLENGSAKVQIEVIRSIMPAIGRQMGGKSESEEMTEMRAKLRELQLALVEQAPDAEIVPFAGTA
jgi:hypothetical protein